MGRVGVEVKVLVTSAGAGPGVAVIKALKNKVRVVACDMNPGASGLYLADERVIVPEATDSDFIPEIIRIVKEKQIDCVLPIFDTETPIFAERKNEIPCKVLVNSQQTTKICNNKVLTYLTCSEYGIPAPKKFCLKELIPKNLPIIRKPIFGIGSKGIEICRTEADLEHAIKSSDGKDIFCQYLYGFEYSVDTLSDLNGDCILAVPRTREVVKAGQTTRGQVVESETLSLFAKRVANYFRLVGIGCVQIMKTNLGLFLIEVNPRAGTGLSHTVGAGANLPYLYVKMAMGEKIEPEELKFKPVYMTRYWEEIFI